MSSVGNVNSVVHRSGGSMLYPFIRLNM